MFLVETWYKTHNGELLAIVKVCKILRHYLKICKHKILVFIDHNKLCYFMNTKSLSSRQVHWVQQLFQYYFQIDYFQNKANVATDALSQFL